MLKKRQLWLRRLHGKTNRIFHPDKTPEKIAKELSKKGFKASLAAKKPDKVKIDYPIDFVVTWVDGGDPEWQREKDIYFTKLSGDEQKENNDAKYRDWDLFRYWFRAVEKYAPWVRNVYLVTYGHIPSWLNTANPKLKIVRHGNFIPKEYLPTFSTRCIELNIWRIPGLSEHFVYFNDDMYLFNEVTKEDFFSSELPLLCAVTTPKKMTEYISTYDYAVMVNLGECNSAFDIRRVMEECPEKWFSYRYGDDAAINEITYRIGYLCGIYNPHLPLPMRKNSMRQCSELFSKRFHETCLRKFRSQGDMNNQIFLLWELLHNTFEPVEKGYYGVCYNFSKNNIDLIKKDCFQSNQHKAVCLNDTPAVEDDFDELQKALLELMESKFSEKSSFEK